MNGFFVTGTDTGVGKTRVTAGLAAVIRQRLSTDRALGGAAEQEVHVWKPVQTGVPSPDSPEADSMQLKIEGKLSQPVETISTHTFTEPLAPWMAARRCGQSIDYASLLGDGLSRLGSGRLVLVEGAGGLAVPLTEHKLIAHLAADLGLPLLIVARPGLGTVNHTLLTIAMAKQFGIPVAGVILNGYGEGQPGRQALEENAEMIEAFGDVRVLGKLPWIELPNQTETAQWADTLESHIDIDLLLNMTLKR